jgi:uncharacterized protein (TIGR04222 family)
LRAVIFRRPGGGCHPVLAAAASDSRAKDDGHGRDAHLDVYELAYLAAGPRRAVEAAVVALVEAGVLRADRVTGELAISQRRPCSDLEAAVLDVVGFRGPRMLGSVCWRLRADGA